MSKQKLILSDVWVPVNGLFDIQTVSKAEVSRLLNSSDVINLISDVQIDNALRQRLAPVAFPLPIDRSQWAVPHDALVLQVRREGEGLLPPVLVRRVN